MWRSSARVTGEESDGEASRSCVPSSSSAAPAPVSAKRSCMTLRSMGLAEDGVDAAAACEAYWLSEPMRAGFLRLWGRLSAAVTGAA